MLASEPLASSFPCAARATAPLRVAPKSVRAAQFGFSQPCADDGKPWPTFAASAGDLAETSVLAGEGVITPRKQRNGPDGAEGQAASLNSSLSQGVSNAALLLNELAFTDAVAYPKQ